MPSSHTVAYRPDAKAVVFEDSSGSYLFDAVLVRGRVEIDFAHCCDPGGFCGGTYGRGALDVGTQRRVAPLILQWMTDAGFEVDAAGLPDDRWCPSHYKS